MIRFLLKGLIRDRHRSLFPIIIVTCGVMVSVFMQTFMGGFMDDTIRSSAKLDTGHVKIMTRGYREIADQMPNDFAVTGAAELLADLERDHPGMDWAARIKFGGLLDLPDEDGETRSQGPVIGIAADLLSVKSGEKERLNLDQALVRGRLPEAPGEIVISDDFAGRLDAALGDLATLISSTSNGAMAIQNFTIVGTIRFGIAALDRNAMIAHLSDIQYALDMENSAGEIIGISPNLVFDRNAAERIARYFNAAASGRDDDFTPVMVTLRDQRGLGELLDLGDIRIAIILAIFFVVMSLVLWNAGLMSGIRRYGEIGVRLAIGESKHVVFGRLLAESLLIGIVGSAIGTGIGLGASYYLQEVGWDMAGMMQGANMIMSNVMRAKITTTSYYIGFIPGLLATLLGSAASGIGIFKRQTAQLFKELEA